MLLNEFMSMAHEISAEDFLMVDTIYMADDTYDKQDFCKDWKKIGERMRGAIIKALHNENELRKATRISDKIQKDTENLALKNNITKLEGDIDTLETAVDRLENEVETLKKQIIKYKLMNGEELTTEERRLLINTL